LSRQAQAFEPGSSWSSEQRRRKALFALIAALPLSACASAPDLGVAEVDRSLHTGSIATDSGGAADSVRVSDTVVIRNAVSSADLEQANGQALSWANPETGSRGSVTGLAEYKDNDTLCRRFRTTRESFDGVAIYRGDICLASAGAWRIRAFESL
jgi:surface antigen